jgi:flagellar biosynthetic protein FliR
MAINLDPAWIMSVFLVALRVGALLMLSPIFNGLAGLVTVRVLLTLALSLTLVAGLGVPRATVALAPGPVLLASLGEVAVGAVLAFGVHAAFGAFALAGKILDIQSGLGIGTVYDPVTRAGAPLFATMLNLLAVSAFFSMDGHHAFLRGIGFSLQQVAPGAGIAGLAPEPALRQFGLMFSLGVALIVPVMLCLLLVEAGLAVIARVLPQMNVVIVLAPVKIWVGVLVFALTLGVLEPPMGRIYGSIFDYWERVLS